MTTSVEPLICFPIGSSSPYTTLTSHGFVPKERVSRDTGKVTCPKCQSHLAISVRITLNEGRWEKR